MPVVRAIAFVLGLLSATLAHATSQRTFVASTGVDTNTAFNCSIVKPCRGFTAAIGVTSARGEVIVLDSAAYGVIPAITQSVTIIAPTGIYAGISVLSGDGITINAGGADSVTLRGLTINGQGGANGIVITNALAVHIENCVISNLTGFGVNQFAGLLEMKDTIVRNNGNIGVFVHGNSEANLDHVRLEVNNTGLAAEEGGHVTIHDSLVTGSSNIGIVATLATTAIAKVTITRSQISSNVYGVFVDATDPNIALVEISESTVTENHVGIHVSGFGWVSAVRNTIAAKGSAIDLGIGIEVVNTAVAYLDGNYIVSVPDVFVVDLAVAVGSQVLTRQNNTIGTLSVGSSSIVTLVAF